MKMIEFFSTKFWTKTISFKFNNPIISLGVIINSVGLVILQISFIIRIKNFSDVVMA